LKLSTFQISKGENNEVGDVLQPASQPASRPLEKDSLRQASQFTHL
jgi:hypothetical protein